MKATASYALMAHAVYFGIHLFTHVCLYALPRSVYALAVRVPRAVMRWVLGRGRGADDATAERRIHIIAHPTQHEALKNFGLDAAYERATAAPTVASGHADAQTAEPSICHASVYEGPLYNGHLHTILGAFRVFPALPTAREVVRSFDGNRVCLDFMYPSAVSSPRALVVMLPGLTGTSEEVYVRRMTQALLRLGVAVVVLNARGVGDTPLDRPQLFSALFTKDLRHVLARVLTPALVQQHFRVPHPLPVLAVAFSLGGLILSNYVAEQGRQGVPSGLEAAYTVCSPHNLHDGDVALRRPFTQLIYSPALYGGLRRYYLRHKDMLQSLPGVDREALFTGPRPKIDQLRTVRDFDEYVTGPHFGFSGADAYYTGADNFKGLPFSTTPQVCIVAADDPITGPPQSAKRWEDVAAQHKDLVYVQLPTGGHMGFLQGPLAEWRESPSAVETLVSASVDTFVRRWYVKKGLTPPT